KGYKVDENKIGGARALSITGEGEAWVMWPSHHYVVKVGGRGRDSVPSAMVETYADRYPSQLPGGALEGPLPAGPEEQPKKVDKPDYDPKNPRPDIDKYDPKKVKIPDKKLDDTPASSDDDDKPKKKKAKKATDDDQPTDDDK